MADAIGQNVSEVINEQGIMDALGNIIAEMSRLGAKITELNGEAGKITVEAKGTETIEGLTNSVTKITATIKDFSDIQKESTLLVNQYGEALQKSEAAQERARIATEKATAAAKRQAEANLLASNSLAKVKQAMIDLIEKGQINSDMYAKLELRAKNLSEAQKIVTNTLTAENTARKESIQTQKIADQQTQANIKSKEREAEIDARLTQAQIDYNVGLFNSTALMRQEMARLDLQGERTGAMYAYLTERVLAFVTAQDAARLSTTPGQTQITSGANDKPLSAKEQYYASGLQNKQIVEANEAEVQSANQVTESNFNEAKSFIEVRSAAELAAIEIKRLEERLLGLNALMKSGGGGTIGAQAIADTEAKLAALRAENGIITEQIGLRKLTAAEEKQLIAAQSREIKQVEQATLAAEKQTFAYQSLAKAKNMAYRLPALLGEIALFTILFEAVSAITDEFTKLSKAEQLTKDSLDSYIESTKKLSADVANAPFDKKSKTEQKVFEANGLIDYIEGVKDVKGQLEGAWEAYKRIQGLAPGLLDEMTKKQFEQALAAKTLNDQLEKAPEYIRKQTEVEINRAILNETLSNKEKARQQILQNEADKKAIPGRAVYSAADLAKNAYDLKQNEKDHTELLDEFKKYSESAIRQSADLDKKEAELLDQKAKTKDKKEPKGHLKNDLNEQLRTIKEYREQRDAESKLTYENSGRAYDDEYRLLAQNIGHENNAYIESKQLLDKALKAKIISITDYNVKLGELNKESTTISAQAASAERNVDDAIKAEQDKKEAADKEYLQRLKEHQKELKKINEDYQEHLIDNKIREKRLSLPDRKTKYDEQNINISNQQNTVREDDAALNAADQRAAEAHGKVAIDESTPISERTTDETAKYEKDKKEMEEADKEFLSIHKQTAIDAAAAGISASDLEYQKKKDKIELEKQARKELADLTIQLANETAQAYITIQNNQFAVEQQNLEIKAREQAVQNQQQIEAINATTGYQITKDNELAKQAANSAAQQKQIQQEQNSLALKQAIFQKQAAEASILLNTAKAEIGVIASAVDEGIPIYLAIAEGAAVAAIGAVQYAAAASTPLPQFWTGGITQTPYFIAAERGPEMGVTPSGDLEFYNTPGVYNSPIGTDIKNADETKHWISYMNRPYAVNKSGEPKYQMTDKNIVDKLEDIYNVSKNKQPIIINVKSGVNKRLFHQR